MIANRSRARLARPDPRPILVSLLGGGWALMGFFGLLNALVLVFGVDQGIQAGARDVEAEIALAAPELVDESVHERLAIEAERRDLARRFGWPLLAAAGLAFGGGLRLLRRAPWSRTTLLVAGSGAITVSALYAFGMTEIALRPAVDLELPRDVESAMLATAWVQILIQALPVLLGMSLLQHPIVVTYLRGRSPDRPASPDPAPATAGNG